MNANALRSNTATPLLRPPVEDAWGPFDPRRVGVPAPHRIVSNERPPSESPGSTSLMPDAAPPIAQCPFCTESLPAGARHCPLCLREVPSPDEVPAVTTPSPNVSAREQAGAVYTLEAPVVCPECSQEIRTIRVLRVLRTLVSFTSTLPRKGYVIVCPECKGMLSAELSGLI